MLENIEVCIIGYNVFGIDGYGAVNKLIVIKISLYQSEMVVHLLKDGSIKSYDGFDNVASNLSCGLLAQNLLVLVENI
jgi:hypothetical protein